jgi:multidrug resistance efflux pump
MTQGTQAIADLEAQLAATRAELAEIRRERGALRQRVEQAEKAARVTMEQCRASGISFSKILLREALAQAEAEIASLRAAASEPPRTAP